MHNNSRRRLALWKNSLSERIGRSEKKKNRNCRFEEWGGGGRKAKKNENESIQFMICSGKSVWKKFHNRFSSRLLAQWWRKTSRKYFYRVIKNCSTSAMMWISSGRSYELRNAARISPKPLSIEWKMTHSSMPKRLPVLETWIITRRKRRCLHICLPLNFCQALHLESHEWMEKLISIPKCKRAWDRFKSHPLTCERKQQPALANEKSRRNLH